MASIWPSRSVTHSGSTSELREAGIRLPIIAGGGVRTFDDVREYGWAGADAASLGSEAWLKPLWSMPLAPFIKLVTFST